MCSSETVSSGGTKEGEEGVDMYFEPFELQPSIIDVVADMCPEREAEEIWLVVGHSLVEQARDLLEEARVHLEIWRQLKEEADYTVSRATPLPEPPMVRERLIQEIHFLADHLRAKTGSPPLGSTTSSRNKEILDYALNADQHGNECCGGNGRPASAVSSRDGRDTPLRLSTPSSNDGSHSSLQSGGVQNVSLTNIDSTVQYIREELEEEISQRREDIAFLQECSEGESLSPTPLPSIRELREVGTQLEREVMKGMSRGTSSPPAKLLPISPPGKCPGRSHWTTTRRSSGTHTIPPITHSIINIPDESHTVSTAAQRPRMCEAFDRHSRLTTCGKSIT